MVSVTDTIRYIGVNDHQIDLFEGQYPVPNGMAYNSYVILDQKIAVMDTVDINFTQEWLRNLETELGAENLIISSSSTWSRIIPPASGISWKLIQTLR